MRLFSGEGFPPRWYCGEGWSGPLGWLHIISDVLVFLAYMVIPVYIYYRRTRQKPEDRVVVDHWVAGFFVLCGGGHLWEAVIVWHPFYRFTGLWKLATAVVSWTAVAMLYAIIRNYRTAGEYNRVADELHNINDRLELVLDNSTEGIYGADLKGNCLFASRSSERLLGWTPEEMLGKNLHYLFHHTKRNGDPYPIEECSVFIAFKEDRAIINESDLFFKRDGTPIEVRFSSTPMRGPTGKVIGTLVTFRDVTADTHHQQMLVAELDRLRKKRSVTTETTQQDNLDNLIARMESLQTPNGDHHDGES